MNIITSDQLCVYSHISHYNSKIQFLHHQGERIFLLTGFLK